MSRFNDEIFAERGRDTFVFQLIPQPETMEFCEDTRQLHLKWFTENDVHHEPCCGRSWINDYSGQYYVKFEWNDPTLIKWCSEFETDTGESKDPRKYVLMILTQEWYDDYVDKSINTP